MTKPETSAKPTSKAAQSADPSGGNHDTDTAQIERFNQIADKINESIRADRASGAPNGLAGSCPVGARTEFVITTGKIHYYSCAIPCFATRDSVPLSNLDFEKMTILTIPPDPNWAWVKIPCRADQGKCIEGVMGTVGQGTTGCNQPQKQQSVWMDELNVVSRTENARTIYDYFKDFGSCTLDVSTSLSIPSNRCESRSEESQRTFPNKSSLQSLRSLPVQSVLPKL
jgi:hypothetical protein